MMRKESSNILLRLEHKRLEISKKILDIDKFYYVAFALWFGSTLLFRRTTMIAFFGVSASMWTTIFFIPSLLLLSVKIIFEDKYTFVHKIIIAIVLLVFMVSSYKTRTTSLLTNLVFVIGAIDVDLKKIAKLTFSLLTFLLPLIFLLAITGVIENVSILRIDATRWSLGFQHPNALGACMVNYVFSWLYWKWPNLGLNDYIWIVIIAGFTYLVPDSRTAVLLITFMLSIVLIHKNVQYNKISNLINRLLYSITIFVPYIALFIVYYYNSLGSFGKRVSELLSNRLYLVNAYFRYFGFTFFGRTLETNKFVVLDNKEYWLGPLDNAYIDMAIRQGLFVLIIIVVTLALLSKYALKKKKKLILIWTSITVLYGFTELLAFNLSSNFGILFISLLFNDTSLKSIRSLRNKIRN